MSNKTDKLTIAQALRRIKKLKGQLAEHQQRAVIGVSYLSTAVPAFRFKDEVAAMKTVRDELIDLESRVAMANAKKFVKEGNAEIALTTAIRVLQEIKGEIAFLDNLSLVSGVTKQREQEWNDEKNQYINRVVEITRVSDLTEVERNQQVKELKDRFETLNNAVEEANHKVMV